MRKSLVIGGIVITIEGLRSFIVVANSKSITEAADKLFISTQGLSQSIRRIEDELNVPLFRRTPEGIRLSRVGRQVYDYAIELVALADKIHACAMTDMKRNERLRFAVGQSRCGDTITSKLISLCNTENVRTKFITFPSSSEGKRLLAGRDADIVLLYNDSLPDTSNTGGWVYKSIAKLYCQPVINRHSPIAQKVQDGTLFWEDLDKTIITIAREKWTHKDTINDIATKFHIDIKTNYCYDTSYCLENVRKNANMIFFATKYLAATVPEDDDKLLVVKMRDNPLYKELVAAIRSELSESLVVSRLLLSLSEYMEDYSPL